MGYDINCISLPNNRTLRGEYFCTVCKLLLDPNESLQSICSHVYCKPCLAFVASTNKMCPFDGWLVTEAHAKPLVESDKSLADDIGKIVVHCLYQTSGCNWRGLLSESSSHRSRCAFGSCLVPCRWCKNPIMHRQLTQHYQVCTEPQEHMRNYYQFYQNFAECFMHQQRAPMSRPYQPRAYPTPKHVGFPSSNIPMYHPQAGTDERPRQVMQNHSYPLGPHIPPPRFATAQTNQLSLLSQITKAQNAKPPVHSYREALLASQRPLTQHGGPSFNPHIPLQPHSPPLGFATALLGGSSKAEPILQRTQNQVPDLNLTIGTQGDAATETKPDQRSSTVAVGNERKSCLGNLWRSPITEKKGTGDGPSPNGAPLNPASLEPTGLGRINIPHKTYLKNLHARTGGVRRFRDGSTLAQRIIDLEEEGERTGVGMATLPFRDFIGSRCIRALEEFRRDDASSPGDVGPLPSSGKVAERPAEGLNLNSETNKNQQLPMDTVSVVQPNANKRKTAHADSSPSVPNKKMKADPEA